MCEARALNSQPHLSVSLSRKEIISARVSTAAILTVHSSSFVSSISSGSREDLAISRLWGRGREGGREGGVKIHHPVSVLCSSPCASEGAWEHFLILIPTLHLITGTGDLGLEVWEWRSGIGGLGMRLYYSAYRRALANPFSCWHMQLRTSWSTSWHSDVARGNSSRFSLGQ